MSSSVGRKCGGRNELFSTSRREELALGPVNRRGQKPSAAKARITVTVRKKPLTPEELTRNEADVIDIVDRQNLILQEPRRELAGNEKTTSHQFGFDRVYDENCSNHYIYNSCVRKLVNTVFREGTRCSCFAFGQTGSGKTYTMMGTRKSEAKGLWEWAAMDIISWMAQPQFKEYELAVSFFEIHCNKAYDLLSSRKLVRPLEGSDGGVVVKDLTETPVTTLAELLDLIDVGNNARSTGRNSRNNESSRSHAILSVVVRRAIGQTSTTTYTRRAAPPQTVARKQDSSKGGSSNDRNVTSPTVETTTYSVYGKIAFIDLAGSERGADTVQFGRPAQQDGAGINKSLLALKECIRAMDQGKGHIPFRDSELTKILRDFFTNPNGLCLMIATTSSSFSCVEQTLNTLRYAQRFIAVRQNAKPCIDELPENLIQANQPVAGEGPCKLMDSQLIDEDEDYHYANSSERNSSSDQGEIDSADRNPAGRKLFGEGTNRLLQSAASGFAEPALSSSSSRSGANQQPTRGTRMLRRDDPSEHIGHQQCNSKPTPDSPASENFTKYGDFLNELSDELDLDLRELLTEPFDARTREVLQKTISVNNAGTAWGADGIISSGSLPAIDSSIRALSDDDFRSLYEDSSSEVWVSYREMLGHQNVYLRDVCQLIQAHVRICKVMDNDLDKKDGLRPSLANNPATLPAKTASIDPGALETSRIFLEREIGLLLKLALELNRVQANLQKCNQLEKEEKRRSVQTVQVFNNKRNKPTG